ncbi:MAG: queuosine precursor transporter [Alphaproteobacteria bacterium]|nr:queuosine precursor transporter [Alphaproteobacteria bacterium]
MSLCTLSVSFIAILVAVKLFGKSGLFVYTAIAVVASNLQVLKLTKYGVVDNPIALGTVIFATVFAVDNILTEYYGAETATKNVWLSFFGYLFFAIIMEIAVLHPAVVGYECTNLHEEFGKLLSPSMVLLFSSLISYAVGQLTDIFLFSALKKMTRGKYVSVRSFVSMAISTFLDNCVFSVCAWVIFAKNPVSWKTLWYTYIFITYLLRLSVAILCVPLVKLAGVWIKKRRDVPEF